MSCWRSNARRVQLVIYKNGCLYVLGELINYWTDYYKNWYIPIRIFPRRRFVEYAHYCSRRSPIVLLKKKDGSTRFYVNYRKLKEVAKKSSYPLPRIDDTLDTLSGANWFSMPDLKSGFRQVKNEDCGREKTTSGRERKVRCRSSC
ncbi:uncharacterized protein LOC128869227 [Anastrepha ludens]|uniref:uncharacterized protein LOC128869227 n=1 Tax=Anastrepha ludens TaxID=28586 RepID=UPI0023AFC570|nr:uncharacterized protein LOC128869227 [Anastrepha ludens]